MARQQSSEDPEIGVDQIPVQVATTTQVKSGLQKSSGKPNNSLQTVHFLASRGHRLSSIEENFLKIEHHRREKIRHYLFKRPSLQNSFLILECISI